MLLINAYCRIRGVQQQTIDLKIRITEWEILRTATCPNTKPRCVSVLEIEIERVTKRTVLKCVGVQEIL